MTATQIDPKITFNGRSSSIDAFMKDNRITGVMAVKDGKVVLENEAGDRLFEVDGIEDPRAAQWFAYDKFTLPQRAALCAYFLRVQK